MGEIINIGNTEEHAILHIAKLVKSMMKSSSEITFGPLPVDDPTMRCPDISKASRLLGWAPQVTLEEGLQRTIENYAQKPGT